MCLVSMGAARNLFFLRATAHSAKRVLAIVILYVRLSVCHDSRPGTDSSPGEIETLVQVQHRLLFPAGKFRVVG